jgi:multidrug efflux pump subunit AcrB
VKILERSIDRPLPIFLAAALIVLFGLWALAELPVKRSPKIEIPYSVIYVPYIGAPPDDIESEITIDLDDRLDTLDDLRHHRSIASDGYSTHILEFEDRTDMKESLRSVRDEANMAVPEFPEDADAPIVYELSVDEHPIVFFTLRGADLYRLRDIAEDLAPELESVPGVSRVDVFGGLEREVHVLADPPTLAQYGLTLGDLMAVLGQQSHSRPAGELRAPEGQRLIRTTGEYASIEEIRSTTISSGPEGSIQLRDIADIELGHVRRTSAAWLDGEPSVTLIVKRRPDINTMKTVAELEAKVSVLRASLPPGVRIDTTSNAADVIARMIRQLGTSAGFGLVLVVLALFSVFGFRRALLVGSVLPMSLLFTFIGLYVFGMEISNIALFSLILVLGMVVDGAIIVGEAIYAEAESGAGPREAAKLGITRVGLPVLAADLTTVAAFLPMLMMVGLMGQFMSVMPKVVCFAIIGSIFVDHFLLPATAAKLSESRSRPATRLAPDGLPWFSPELPRLRRRYRIWLARALRHRAWVIAGAGGAFCLALALYASGLVESIFLPKTDRGRFTINYSLPRGTSLLETNRVGQLLTGYVEAIPELDHYVLITGETGALSMDGREGGRNGPEYGRISVDLIDSSERGRSQGEIVSGLRGEFERYAGVEVDLEELTEGPGVGAALAIRVKGDGLVELAEVARDVEARLAALPGATDVRVDYDNDRPEIRVALDRARAAARFGISPDQVANALLTTFHGVEAGRMWVGDERVDIRLRAPDTTPRTLDQVGELPLRTRDGGIVPLGEVATLHIEFGKNAIFRHDGRRAITVRADALDGTSSVALEAAARESLGALVLPAGIALEFGGETEERDRSYASLWNALKWGLLLIYVIIAVQFNSLKQPFVVLLSVPLSVVGVTLGLLVTGTPFSFVVFIGVVSLTGIVVNDGIVLVDAINRIRRAGMDMEGALLAASAQRLRPVLLTTVTTIAGLLPLTLNLASGGEFWVPLGVAIISGLMVASALTLFVVPVLYSFVEGGRRWRAGGVSDGEEEPRGGLERFDMLPPTHGQGPPTSAA